jgi:hypothetical protein
MLGTRSRLEQKYHSYRQRFEGAQVQKKVVYDGVLQALDEIDQVESELQLLRISKLSM